MLSESANKPYCADVVVRADGIAPGKNQAAIKMLFSPPKKPGVPVRMKRRERTAALSPVHIPAGENGAAISELFSDKPLPASHPDRQHVGLARARAHAVLPASVLKSESQKSVKRLFRQRLIETLKDRFSKAHETELSTGIEKEAQASIKNLFSGSA